MFLVVIQSSKSWKKVVLSGDVYELRYLFLLTRRIMEADSAGGWVF